MLINIATYVHIRKFETGNRTNLKRSISVCRYAYNEYKNIFDNISLVNNCNKYLIRFVKNIQHDRNINTIRLLVSIHTGNRLCRKTETITIIHKNKKHYDTSNSKKTAKQVANIFVNRPQKR